MVTNRINAFVKNAKDLINKINKGGNPFSLSFTQTSDMTTVYNNLRTIAIGYSVEGSDIYKDSSILESIIYLLDYMHNNYFSKR